MVGAFNVRLRVGDQEIEKVAIKNPGRGLPLQGRRGAPAGNRNAGRHGLYSERPSVLVPVGADASLDDLAVLVEMMEGAALWIAEELDAVEDPTVEVGDLDVLVALYAAVAGECAHLQAEIEGRGLKAAALGELETEQYERLLGKSARALELLLSRAASAKARLEGSGMLVATKYDNVRGVNPVLKYLASIFRKAQRQALRHGQYLVWAQRVEDRRMGDDPLVILSAAREGRDGRD